MAVLSALFVAFVFAGLEIHAKKEHVNQVHPFEQSDKCVGMKVADASLRFPRIYVTPCKGVAYVSKWDVRDIDGQARFCRAGLSEDQCLKNFNFDKYKEGAQALADGSGDLWEKTESEDNPGAFYIRNIDSGKCLTAKKGTIAAVVHRTCDDEEDQLFYIGDVPNGNANAGANRDSTGTTPSSAY